MSVNKQKGVWKFMSYYSTANVMFRLIYHYLDLDFKTKQNEIIQELTWEIVGADVRNKYFALYCKCCCKYKQRSRKGYRKLSANLLPLFGIYHKLSQKKNKKTPNFHFTYRPQLPSGSCLERIYRRISFFTSSGRES